MNSRTACIFVSDCYYLAPRLAPLCIETFLLTFSLSPYGGTLLSPGFHCLTPRSAFSRRILCSAASIGEFRACSLLRVAGIFGR